MQRQMRWTGILGIVIMILTLIEVPLYFMYSGPPPVANILARTLFDMALVPAIVIFFASLRGLIVKSSPKLEWAATLLLILVAMNCVLIFVANSMEAGLAIATGHNIDPTIKANATYLLYGSIGRVMTTLFLGAAGYLTVAAGLLPKWTKYLAYILAFYSAAFIPSMFFGNDPSHFYSANGWGTTAIGSSSIVYWILAAGIVFVRRARKMSNAS